MLECILHIYKTKYREYCPTDTIFQNYFDTSLSPCIPKIICLSFFIFHANLYIVKRDIETGQCGRNSDVTTTGKKGSKMTGAGN